MRGWLIGFAVLGAVVWGILRALPDTPAPQSVLPVETVPVVPSATGTATVDLLPTLAVAETAKAQAEANSMQAQQERIFVEQTSEALHIEAARITERARADVLTATAQADAYTATARAVSVTESYRKSEFTATAFLPMATLQAGVLADREAQREHEAAQPVREQLLAQIENERKYGGWQIFGAIFALVVVLVIVLLVWWRTRPIREDSAVLPPPKFIEPTFERTDLGSWKRVDPVIPCTAEQLADFAEAVIDGERQMGVHGPLAVAFGPREDYILFREWLAGNGFTEPAARAGEVQPSLRGLAFLRVVVTTGSPPPPYVFRVNDGEQPGRSVPYTVYSGGGVGEDV